METEKH